ncbi:DUF1778 domain-containing protein [Tabrizicola sp.]|jgi:uncharacterized protein (DUF1778 family)|uniref:type II toxin-antitoxin system TacA family antitoxin n=1 Tax=Tabrizicola sp. TaxID=2005166 RepID=UPI001A58CF63|nr:DUF1778 domain-containing protein [Tabrizicola sp.]MBL9074861.1 DUF1778 domain-containing protein [Tabrizicola sp.]
MTQTTRSERIEARTTPDTLAIVRRAAEIQGRSISEFVVSAAEEAARKALEEVHVLHLSAADQRLFVELLLNPPPPNEAMLRAFEHHRRLIGPV